MGKKILAIIAPKNFRDEEYFIPRDFFEREGFVVKTASIKKGLAVGTYGGEVMADIQKEDIDVRKFDALFFVGGKGAIDYLDNEDFYRIAQKAVEEELTLGAICVAPVILANAGILEGQKATVWSSSMEKGAVKLLQERGVLYKNEGVVRSGKIITASGPEEAENFAREIIKEVLKVDKDV
jgi:protease I